MYSSETTIRVRYGETDQMGFVYYGNYALYYEVGRVEAIRALGITYKLMEEQGILLPVVRLEAKYIQPARYDDLLTIISCIPVMPDRFIEFEVKIMNQAASLLHQARVVLCFKSADTGQAIRAPEFIKEKLRPYYS